MSHLVYSSYGNLDTNSSHLASLFALPYQQEMYICFDLDLLVDKTLGFSTDTCEDVGDMQSLVWTLAHSSGARV